MGDTEEAQDPRGGWGARVPGRRALLGPYAEVVLHDPDTDRVLEIWNPMGSRGPGDPSLLGELDELDRRRRASTARTRSCSRTAAGCRR